MSEYRLKSDGSVKTKSEVVALFPNTSIPKIWTEQVCSDLGIDVVFETPQPTSSEAYKHYVRNGVEQNDKDQWVQAWVERDMFAATDDKTKSEQETEYQTKLDAAVAKDVRVKRNNLLAATDWLGMSDVTMSTAWATYRQALRDVPGQSGFPNNITWPDEP